MRVFGYKLVCGLGLLAALAFSLPGCPGPGPVRPDEGAAPVEPSRTGLAGPARAPLQPVERPRFDPDAQPPCDSHTACYLAAKQAHESGERAGYLLALERCEYYRGRYQLEEFYGLCLLILADAYRQLDNFNESAACYQRFLDSHPDETELALQARAAKDEVTRGATTPHDYHDYLAAVALLVRHGNSGDPALLEQARAQLEQLSVRRPDWALAEQVRFLLSQIAQATAPLAPAPHPGD